MSGEWGVGSGEWAFPFTNSHGSRFTFHASRFTTREIRETHEISRHIFRVFPRVSRARFTFHASRIWG